MFLDHYYADTSKYRTCLFPVLLILIWLSCYMDYCYMGIPVIPLHDCFPLLILIYIVIGHECCWYVMYGIKCHVDLKPRGPPLESHIYSFLFPVSYYQQSSCHVIVLHVPYTVLVPDILCNLNIIEIAWIWGRLDGWLDLIGWMYWIHIYPTAGNDSDGYRLYISP